jgi:hypothetical protein
MKCRIDAIAAAMVMGLSLSIAGCGGSGSSLQPPPTPDAATTGIWTGTFVQGEDTFDIFALIAGERANLLSPDAGGGNGLLYEGSVATSGNNLSGNLTAFRVGGLAQFNATLSGTLREGESASGTFTPTVGNPGTFTLVYDPLSARGSSLENVSDNWQVSAEIGDLVIAIDTNGTLSGQDSAGCTYNGAVEIIDPAINVYSITATRTGCSIGNGDYSGLAAVIDGDNENDTLRVIVSNDVTNVVIEFTRDTLPPV